MAAAAAAQFTVCLTNCNVNNAAEQWLIAQGFDTCDSFLGNHDSNMKAVCRRMINPGTVEQSHEEEQQLEEPTEGSLSPL